MDQSLRRPLGRTGLTPAPVGFGAFKIGRNQATKYDAAYALPDDVACEALLDAVLEMGIDLIDTAPAYGTSEERIGRLLSGRRDEFILSTKVGETFEDGVGRFDFSASAIDQSVTRSLRRLRTDRLDLVFVHSDGGDVAIIDALRTPPANRLCSPMTKPGPRSEPSRFDRVACAPPGSVCRMTALRRLTPPRRRYM